MSLYTYEGLVERVIDADTLVVSLSLGFHIWLRDQHIRLAHLNAPEILTRAGLAARDFVAGLLGPLPARVTVATLKDRQDNYGRYLGVFTTAAGIEVNQALLASGHAVPSEGRKVPLP